MDSPLDVIFTAIAKKAGRPTERLPPDRYDFVFGGEFPDKPSEILSPLEYLVTVSWDETKRSLSISTATTSCSTFAQWDGMEVFFKRLSSTVSLFTEVWPGGWLTPLFAEEKPGLLRLGHHAKLSCPRNYDVDAMKTAFKEVNECATQALLFTRPISEQFALQREAPPVEDVLRMLSIEFERYESYLFSKGENPPRVPRWFGVNRQTKH